MTILSVLAPPHRSHPAADAIGGIRRAGRLRHRVAAHVYLPACAIAALGAGLIAFGWARDWGGVPFDASAATLRAVVAGPATVAFVAVFMVVERIWPAQARSPFARGYRHDLVYTVLNATILVPLVTALTLAFVDVLRAVTPWIVLPRIGGVPRWVFVIVLLVVMDACNWFVHLANHRVRMLWRFHELHHSQEDMSTLTVFRTHPLLHVSYLLTLIPGMVLLANGSLSVAILVGYSAYVAFAHSNTRLGFGPLERVFVSPNFHRIHHRLEGAQDVNLGFVLTVWDQLFGRAVFPTPSTVGLDTGLPGRPLMVEQSTPRPRHLRVLWAQMVGPFRPLDASVGAPPRSVPESPPPVGDHAGVAPW